MWQIFWKELLELRQNPRMFGIVIVAPIIQLTILGYAANMDVKNVPVVIADGSRTAESRRLISRFEGSPYFTIIDVVTTVQQIDSYIEHGTAWMALVIPYDYAERVARGERAAVQVIADGSDANSTTLALGYAANLVGVHSEELQLSRAATAPPRPRGGSIDARIRVWYNPQLISREFMLPALSALLLLVITVNLTSMAIVREREVGTYEQ